MLRGIVRGVGCLQGIHSAAEQYFVYQDSNAFIAFCTAVGALHGAFLAVHWSTDLLIIQHTASRYAPGFLEELQTSGRRVLSRLLIFLFLGVAILSVFASPSSRLDLILLNVALLLSSLLIVLRNLNLAHRWLNPVGILADISGQARQIMEQLKGSPSVSVTEAANRQWKRFCVRFHQVLDFLRRAVAQQERDVVDNAISSLLEIISSYTNATASKRRSQDDTLNSALECLEQAANQAITQGNKDAVISIVRGVGEIGILYLRVDCGEPSVFASHFLAVLPAAYVRKITLLALLRGMEDVGMEAGTRLGRLAVALSDKGYMLSCQGIVDELAAVGRTANTLRMLIATMNAHVSLMSIVMNCCSKASDESAWFRSLIEKAKIFNLCLLGKEGHHYLGEHTVSPALNPLSSVCLAACALRVMAQYSAEELRPIRRGTATEVPAVRDITLALRECGEQAAKIEGIAVVCVLQSLEMMGRELLSRNASRGDSFEVEAMWVIGSIGIVCSALTSSRSVAWNTAREGLTALGAIALSVGHQGFSREAMSGLVENGHRLMTLRDKGGWGSDEPIVAACLIACALTEKGYGRALPELLKMLREVQRKQGGGENWTAGVEEKLFEIEQRMRGGTGRHRLDRGEGAIASLVGPPTIKLLRKSFFRVGLWPGYTVSSTSLP